MSSDGYLELLKGAAIPTVSLGYVTVHIFSANDLDEAQTGYSVDPSGTSLIDHTPGSWQENWIVIGYEDESGNPIFIDTNANGFPVYTAMHGTGNWEPTLISLGLRNFAIAMRQMATIAQGRENPVQFEKNPITPDEHARVLNEIAVENPGIDLSFWDNWLAAG